MTIRSTCEKPDCSRNDEGEFIEPKKRRVFRLDKKTLILTNKTDKQIKLQYGKTCEEHTT